MKVVIDTNVLVSGMISSTSYPARIVDMVRTSRIQPVVDDRILEEYADVMRRDYLQRYFSIGEAENIIDFLRYGSVHIVAEICVAGLPDSGDVPFLETALTADVPLVTGNMKHFPPAKCHNCIVLTPREYIETFVLE